MKKVLIITYYWPPSGGSGVQRWMYFAKYLPEFGIEPFVVTVDPAYASYKFIDESFEKKATSIKVYKTRTSEPFNAYSKIIGKSKEEAIPQGFTGESNPGLLQKISRFIRGNFFIPDARIGWIKFAVREAVEIITKEKIDIIITTGPPHSTHLIGLQLKKKFQLKWIADFRDPWTELFYNKLFYRTSLAKSKDQNLEKQVLSQADVILTIGPSMAEMLRAKISAKSKSMDVKYIFNGYDQEVFQNLKRTKANDSFIICHLGILSDNQPIDGFIEAMKIFYKANELKNKPIQLLLIGKISPGILNKLKTEVPGLNLILKNYLPHNEAMQEIINADLLFNSLADVADGKYLISGKLMEYIATGNPILCLGEEDGDASKLLNQFKDSKVLKRNNVNGIYQHIQDIFNKWLKGEIRDNVILSQKYSRYNTTAELAAVIKKLN